MSAPNPTLHSSTNPIIGHSVLLDESWIKLRNRKTEEMKREMERETQRRMLMGGMDSS